MLKGRIATKEHRELWDKLGDNKFVEDFMNGVEEPPKKVIKQIVTDEAKVKKADNILKGFKILKEILTVKYDTSKRLMDRFTVEENYFAANCHKMACVMYKDFLDRINGILKDGNPITLLDADTIVKLIEDDWNTTV